MSEKNSGAVPGTLREDGWVNVLTGYGTERDKRTHARFAGARPIISRQFLDELYAGSDVVARIVDLPAEEMTREWIDLRVGDGPEVAKAMLQRLEDLDLQTKTEEALRWARLHGGAVMLLGVDDGQTPDKPLREDGIRTFGWVTVLDRWDVQVESLYEDPFQPKFGAPKSYRIIGAAGVTKGPMNAIVHESRVIRFDGPPTSRYRKERLNGWCDSIVSRLQEIVRDFESAYAGAAASLLDFSIGVAKIKDLATLLASDQDDLVRKRLHLLDMAASIVRSRVIDAENEDFTFANRTLAGMSDVLDRLAQRLSLATGIPVTLLMGQSPAGLQATGASDIRFWYDKVKADQSKILGPTLGRVIQLLFRSSDGPTGGEEPEDWSLDYRPLWQPTEKEQAETRYIQAQTDVAYIDRGVLSPSHVAISRFGGDRWSMETSVDPDEWEDNGEPVLDPLADEGGDE